MTAHIDICGGRPCQQRSRDFAGVLERVKALGKGPLSGAITECLGPCKQAPLATLHLGYRTAMFAGVYEACDWEAVLGYSLRAAEAGTLLVDSSDAQTYLYDPVHPDHGTGREQRLAFLIGHVAGDGCHADGSSAFHKEVIGSWEAGGRFVGLRMAVTYALDGGGTDVHNALVLVGYNDTAAAYEARAYTDGGTTRDYRLTLDGDRLVFDDRVPGHKVKAAAARKVLIPCGGGYDEVLEIRQADGLFEPYSTVELRKRS